MKKKSQFSPGQLAKVRPYYYQSDDRFLTRQLGKVSDYVEGYSSVVVGEVVLIVCDYSTAVGTNPTWLVLTNAGQLGWLFGRELCSLNERPASEAAR